MEVKLDVVLHEDGEVVTKDRKLTIVGHPSEDLDEGMVLLICDSWSVEVDRNELARALQAFKEAP